VKIENGDVVVVTDDYCYYCCCCYCVDIEGVDDGFVSRIAEDCRNYVGVNDECCGRMVDVKRKVWNLDTVV